MIDRIGSSDLTAAPGSPAEALARRLEQEILGGSLPLGHRLGSKEELRRRFRVAVATVNEAVRALERRGLVEARSGLGGGLFVASPSPPADLGRLARALCDGGAGAADCRAVRGALDGLVAEEAARHATAADVAELRQLLAALAEHADDPRAFLQHDVQLHRRIAETSPNGVLRSLYGALLDVVESERDEIACDDAFDAAASVELHRELIDAIASRDPAHAAEAVRRHAPATARDGAPA